MNNKEIFKLIELKTRQMEATSNVDSQFSGIRIDFIRDEIKELEKQLK